MRDIKITLFAADDAYHLSPTTTQTTWEAFALQATRHTAITDKGRSEAWSPGHYPPGARRGAKSVTGCDVVALDFDGLPHDQAASVIAAANEYSAFVYSSFSHAKKHTEAGTYSFRLCLLLSRTVTPQEWPAVWGYVAALFPGCDPAPKSTASLFFAYASPASEHIFAEIYAGKVIDVDAIDTAPQRTTQLVQLSDTLSPRELKQVVRKLKKGTDKKRQTAAWLEALQAGEVWTEANRHASLLQITEELDYQLPYHSPLAIVGLFKQSFLELSQRDDSFEITQRMRDLERMIAGARERRLTKQAQEKPAEKTELYSADELDALAKIAGVTRDRLHHFWILGKGGQYYLLTLSGYVGPIFTHDMLPAIRDLLPRAGVECVRQTDKGPQQIPIGQIYEGNGSVIDRIEYDMTVQQSYRTEDGVLRLACAKVRSDLRPQYDSVVDGWLRTLVSQAQWPKFEAWLATATRLGRQTAMLYLFGPKGTGKTLLVRGLSEIYTRGAPTQLDDVIGDWNEGLLDCPIVTLDEGSGRLKLSSQEFRKLTGQTKRKLRIKYQHETALIGCPRVIFAANNMQLLNFGEEHSREDMDAIDERVLIVNCRAEAGEYLLKLKAEGFDIDREFFDGNRFAQHLLHLRDTVQVDASGRFLVAGNPGECGRIIATQGGSRSQVSAWLVDAATRYKELTGLGKHAPFWDNGEFFVNTTGVVKGWDVFIDDGRHKPDVNACGSALRGLQISEKKIRADGGSRIVFKSLDLSVLVEWANNAGYGDTERILDYVSVKYSSKTIDKIAKID